MVAVFWMTGIIAKISFLKKMTIGRLICDVPQYILPNLGSQIKDGGFMVSDLERTSWFKRKRRKKKGGC